MSDRAGVGRTPTSRDAVRGLRGSSWSALPGPVIAVAVGASYLALAQYVIWLNDPVNAGAGYWPAAGVTLAALLLLPTRRWGWVLGAVVAAELGGDALHGYPLAASGWWAFGNAAEPLVAAVLLRRCGSDGRLSPLRDLGWFLAAGVLVGPAVGAAVGSIGTSGVYDVGQVDVLLRWWAGDGLGVLVIAPLLLAHREPPVVGRRVQELWTTTFAAALVSLLAFRHWDHDWGPVVPYLVFPVVMVASARLGIRGTAIVGVVVAELANLSNALGHGPFRLAGGSGESTIVALQIFLASTLTAGLVIATLVHEALERTRLYERERLLAEALQFAVMPAEVPAAAGVDVAARYLPSAIADNVHIGGDWYDVFATGHGSTALVIGDVMGHDLPAAVAMAQLRNGLRSLMTELHDPARVMAALNRQLLTAHEGMLASLTIALHQGDGELRWANAGHPPLLHATAQGTLFVEEPPGPILGAGGLRLLDQPPHAGRRRPVGRLHRWARRAPQLVVGRRLHPPARARRRQPAPSARGDVRPARGRRDGRAHP